MGLAVAGLTGTACAGREATHADDALAAMALAPSQLPRVCGTGWRTRTLPLVADEDAVGFAEIVGFWTGAERTARVSDLDAGLSSVYGVGADSAAIVILVVRLHGAAAADTLEGVLRARWGTRRDYWVHRGGPRLVIVSSRAAGVPPACAAQVWAEVARRASHAA